MEMAHKEATKPVQAEPEIRQVSGGRLRFRTLFRRFGGDGGPSLEVHMRDGEVWRRVIRFDCFRDYPHWHLFHADGRDDRRPWGTGGTKGALAATESALREQLPTLLERGGYPEVARSLDPSEISPVIAEALADLRALAGNKP